MLNLRKLLWLKFSLKIQQKVLPRFAALPPPPILQNLFITIQTETKPESHRSHIFPCPSANATSPSSAIPRAARRTYVFLTSPLHRLSLYLSPPSPLSSSSSTTTLSSSSSSTTRFINNTEARTREKNTNDSLLQPTPVLIRMGSTDRKVRACGSLR